MDEIGAVVDKLIGPADEFEAAYSSVQLPSVAFLPQRYVFDGGAGLTVNVRSATKQDMPRLYSVMRQVADHGQGYGLDEFPTYVAFCDMISDSYVVVVEQDDSNSKVGIRPASGLWISTPTCGHDQRVPAISKLS